MKVWIKCCLICLVCSTSLGFAAVKKIDGIEAIINNEVITHSEFEHQYAIVVKQLQSANQPLPKEAELRKQILNHIIDINLQLQLAKKSGIEVTQEQIDNTMKKIAERNHMTPEEMKQRLTKENIDFSEYQENLRKELMITELQRQAVAKNIKISDEDVRDFLKSQHDSIAEQQLYHLEDIVIPVEENPSSEAIQAAERLAETVMTKIRSGEDFKSLAITQSQSHTALSGGDLGWRQLAELPEVFTSHVLKMKAGDIAGPIRTGNGFHIIKLINVKSNPAAGNTLTTKAAARDALFRRQFEERIENWVQQLRAHAYIQILPSQSATV